MIALVLLSAHEFSEALHSSPQSPLMELADIVLDCYTRSAPSYKLLSEYNLILTQRLTSYPLVLVGL
jgi:hypothetical protein